MNGDMASMEMRPVASIGGVSISSIVASIIPTNTAERWNATNCYPGGPKMFGCCCDCLDTRLNLAQMQ
jgi:hypothetical protein